MLGELLAARYRVVDRLGSGGFGNTYIVEDLQRPGHPRCVLKHLTFNSHDPNVFKQVRRLFQAEAETLEHLGQHDQIPRLLAYFEIDRQFYLVQEFIQGRSLSQELIDGQSLSQDAVIQLLTSVLEVLEFVHSQRVIHRDIKPENLIRRDRDQRLVLIDFGAVKQIGDTAIEAMAEETQPMSIPIYTSGYGASEQCLGKPRYSSDLYSLGMVAIQALTGMRPAQLPHDADTGEVIWRDQVPDSAQLSDRLADFLTKLTRYHFNERYQTAADALMALQSITHSDGTLLSGEETALQFSQLGKVKYRRWLWGSGLAALLTTAGVGGYYWLSRSPTDSLPITNTPSIESRDRISTGERQLNAIKSGHPQKQQAIAHLANHAPNAAIPLLEAANARDRSDPETVIYLNNARIGDRPSHTIAAIVPLGDALGSALEMLRGVAMAQTEVNQRQGIQGKLLKIAIANDDNQPDVAQAIAREFAQNPTVLGVVGHATSDTMLATLPIYHAAGLPVISPLSSAVELSKQRPEESPLFRTIPSDRMMAQALGNHLLKSLKKQKVVIFFNAKSAYSQSFKDEFKNALFYNNVPILDEIDLSRPDFDAAASVQSAIARNAEVMLLAIDHRSMDLAMQVILVNRRRMKILTGDTGFTQKLLNVTGAEATDMVIAVPTAATQSPFHQKAAQQWGSPTTVSWRTVLAYDATQALITALQPDATRDGIRRTLSQPTFTAPGATGPVQFQPSGDRKATVQLMTIRPKPKPGTGYTFVPLNAK